MRHQAFKSFKDAALYAHQFWDVLPHYPKDLSFQMIAFSKHFVDKAVETSFVL